MSPVTTPKSILKRPCYPQQAAQKAAQATAICRSVSFCSEESVRLADSYDRSPASPTTELSWLDIEELRRLELEANGEDVDPLDEAKALMDLPALLAAAPSALLPLLPPITSINPRPVPTLTLPAPRNRGAGGSLAPQKRSASPLPSLAPIRKRPLLAFLPLLPVGDAQPSPGPVPMRNDPNAAPYFSQRPKHLPGHEADSPMTDESGSPVTPPDTRRMIPLGIGKMEPGAAAQSFEITFKRRMENDW